MKKTLLIALLSVSFASASAQFSKYFADKTLRLDFYHCGTATTENYFIKELIEEPFWGGSKTSLIDTKEYGNQLFKVVDPATGTVLYSQGYCTLFDEWQTTAEAQTTQKCYPEAVVMPFPKIPVRVEFWARDAKNIFNKKFEYMVNPESYNIVKRSPSLETFEVVYNGAPARKIDIVLIPEGYTKDDRAKFAADCKIFADVLFKYSPFKEQKRNFNIRAVWAPSADAGVTLPGENLWRNTTLDARYYTFDSERYQMVNDFQRVRDVASNVPYEYIYVISNTKKYGGGGIYNFYGISSSGNDDFTAEVYVHEFGHLFIGLGDEYVGTTGYDEFYAKDVEPWEENLTTLVDFKKKDWSKMLPADIVIPTPATPENSEKLGVYEGGGYQNKGIYRPWVNCMMRDLSRSKGFCPVCQKALNDKIESLIK